MLAPDTHESVASGADLAALEQQLDVVPMVERFFDLRGGDGVPLAHVVHRGIREHHTPSERVVGLVALHHDHLVIRVLLLHQEREVQARGSTTDADDFHGFGPCKNCFRTKLFSFQQFARIRSNPDQSNFSNRNTMAINRQEASAQATAERPGREAGLSHEDHQAVRLWLRLLTCSTQIEQTIRGNLQAQFGTTLSRFDYLAQLSRFPEGLRMKTLSEYLMVTGGNVTGLTDQLVGEGWVERVADENDRRSMTVRLTKQGVKQFNTMAAEHELWLEQLFAPFGASRAKALFEQLGQLREVLDRSCG